MKYFKEKLLSGPKVFNFFNWLVERKNSIPTLVKEYIQPKPESNILDIGCGTGYIVKYLGNVNYDGYDMSEKYIEYAKKKKKLVNLEIFIMIRLILVI